MRFRDLLLETNIPPNAVPDFDDFVNEWQSEIDCWRLPGTHVDDPVNQLPDGFTPAHLQMLVDRINAVDLNNIYRGIVCTRGLFRRIKPGIELGSHWTWDREVAEGFADGGGMDDYDDRFEDHQEAVGEAQETFGVIFHGATTPQAIDVWYTLGNACDGFEKELDLGGGQPITLHGIYVCKRGGYKTGPDGKLMAVPNSPWVYKRQYAGQYFS